MPTTAMMSFFKQLATPSAPRDSLEAPECEDLVDKSIDSFDRELDFRLLQRKHRRLKRWMAFLLALLIFTVVVLAITDHRRRKGMEDLRSPYPVPEMPWTTRTFERDERFAAPSSAESDEAWFRLMPPGDGFLLIPNSLSRAASLPPGKKAFKTNDSTIYDTTLFHQLHCLSHIRTYLCTLQSSVASTSTANATEVWEVLLKPQEDHILHCFDYIRQGLMCAGDLTLEWPRTEEDGRRFAVDGWGMKHVCRDWDAMMEWVAEFDVVGRGG